MDLPLTSNPPSALDPGFYHQLVKVCELEMEGGVRELGSSASASSNERAFHVICILSAATDMLVWASRNDTGEGAGPVAMAN